MKKLFLLLIIPFFFISLYAVDPDPTADATVQLNLTTDHFVIGFAREEGNAKAYKSDTNTTFVLETHVNVEDKILKTTAEGSFFILSKFGTTETKVSRRFEVYKTNRNIYFSIFQGVLSLIIYKYFHPLHLI